MWIIFHPSIFFHLLEIGVVDVTVIFVATLQLDAWIYIASSIYCHSTSDLMTREDTKHVQLEAGVVFLHFVERTRGYTLV